MPGTLEPPSAIVGRGLDFCSATRALVREARTMNLNYALITDLYRSYLYDVGTDELLLHADDPKTFHAEIAPVLAKADMERGALEEVRREPRSVVARRFREWREHWTDTLAMQTALPAETASLVLDRLTVIRFLFDHDILRRTKWRLQSRFGELLDHASESDPRGVGEGLAKLFHDMWFDWKMDLFEASPALDGALANDVVTASLLREFALLSDAKFSIATVLESFNYGEPAEKMRVRMVPDINEEREHYLNRQRLETVDEARITLDLTDEGYRAIFHWFDRLLALYERLETEFDSHTYRNVPQAQELDLFEWSAMDAHRPSACGDKIGYACEHGFAVYYNDARQYRVGRLMITLHLISTYDQTKEPVDAFPNLSHVMVQRPRVLPADSVLGAGGSEASSRE